MEDDFLVKNKKKGGKGKRRGYRYVLGKRRRAWNGWLTPHVFFFFFIINTKKKEETKESEKILDPNPEKKTRFRQQEKKKEGKLSQPNENRKWILLHIEWRQLVPTVFKVRPLVSRIDYTHTHKKSFDLHTKT